MCGTDPGWTCIDLRCAQRFFELDETFDFVGRTIMYQTDRVQTFRKDNLNPPPALSTYSAWKIDERVVTEKGQTVSTHV